MRPRDWLSVAAIVVLVSGLIGQVANERLAGLSIDCLFWLRSKVFAAAYTPAQSPTVVVALDEETYRRPPFDLAPKALWTREIARVLDALIEGGAKVVGFDVIFSTTAESLTKDGETDSLLPGFDRDFLRALNRASRNGSVVLSKVQHQEWPIHPFPAQIFAVGGERNIRSANLFRDNDEVIRRVALTFESEDAKQGSRTDNSVALELAARAIGQPPAKLPDGGLSLAGYRIPGSERDTMLVNFESGDAIPTYSFADLYECTKGDPGGFFRKQFKDKVVLIGAVVDLEDRQVTSKRFITTQAKQDYSWTPPNRRYIGSGLYLPSLRSEKIGPVVFAIDTSLSMDVEALKQSGVNAHFYVSPNTAHEWQSWRRSLHEFAPLLFQQ